MRTVILIAVLAASSGALQGDGDAVLRTMLRDIPEPELSDADWDLSAEEIERTLKQRDDAVSRSAEDPRLCRDACLAAADSLNAICERHVLPSAALSRAVCYERVDDIRIACVERCDD